MTEQDKLSVKNRMIMLSGDLPHSATEGSRPALPFDPAAPLPKASSEGLNFLDSIDEGDLRTLLFEDVLPIESSDSGKLVGKYQLFVTFGGGKRQPMLTVRGNSIGAIDSVPCGTSITARLTPQLETIEQRIHEYVKLDDYLLDRVTDIIKEKDGYAISRIVTKGEHQEKTEYSVNTANMRGFISEGSNMVLQKLFAKKGIPDNCQLLAMDNSANLCPVVYKSLGEKYEMAGNTTVKVIGIEKMIKTNHGIPIVWHSFYSDDGHLVSRVQLESPVQMRLTEPWSQTHEESMQQQSEEDYEISPTSLDWDFDQQLYSRFLDRKDELTADYLTFINHKTEVRQVMADFLQALLLEKPTDVAAFAGNYFAFYSSETEEDAGKHKRERSASLSYSAQPYKQGLNEQLVD